MVHFFPQIVTTAMVVTKTLKVHSACQAHPRALHIFTYLILTTTL